MQQEPTTTRWKLTVAYDGTDFVGWQRQPQGASIQSELEGALERLQGHPITVHGSGRTDAGVHALGQTCHFDTHVQRHMRAIRDGLNAYLPRAIAVVRAEQVPADFDARRWVIRKMYRYTWLVRPARSPFLDGRVWHQIRPLDVEAMERAVTHLAGKHDFTAFRAVGCASTHPIRIVQQARIVRDGELLHFEIEGNGFLRHMVRILAGTLQEVGLGKRHPDQFVELLAGAPRQRAGRTAPPGGLTLVEVEYGDGPRR